jgi:hypothetical protein
MRLVDHLILPLLFFSSIIRGQFVSTSLPQSINKQDNYLFYLHGAVVTILGNNAINQSVPEWGPYEYLNILDSLSKRGFHVISENRKPGIDDTMYANKIIKQIDTLIKAGVKHQQIIIVGASSGGNIALQVSAKMKSDEIKYVLMGGCWPETYKDYRQYQLYGHFLSIIEASDPHGTCQKIFEGRNSIRSFKEITLHTGLSHGFFYKGRKEWIDPIVERMGSIGNRQ